MTLFLIILFSIFGSAGSVLLAAFFLVLKESVRQKILPYLVSYATGTLLTAALLGLIPHAVEELSPEKALKIVLFGIFAFFILEKIVIWRHCHKDNCETHKASGPMIIIGDAFHNFIDGIIIAASFMISVPVGMAASFSVITHEIPQEVGDFAILLHSGYSKSRALFYNILSGLTTLVAAIAAYFALDAAESASPYIMAVSAASFLYIALVDLSPDLHRRLGIKNVFLDLSLLLAGIMTIIFLLAYFGHSH